MTNVISKVAPFRKQWEDISVYQNTLLMTREALLFDRRTSKKDSCMKLPLNQNSLGNLVFSHCGSINTMNSHHSIDITFAQYVQKYCIISYYYYCCKRSLFILAIHLYDVHLYDAHCSLNIMYQSTYWDFIVDIPPPVYAMYLYLPPRNTLHETGEVGPVP